jgi:4-amino-4-deoxy-L-arabinose transferase-like glycosyltransferase
LGQEVVSRTRPIAARPKSVRFDLRALSEPYVAALLAVTALGAALRFSTLGLQSYSLDEAVTVDLVRKSLGGMLAAIPHSESTPPFYYVVAWIWSKIFGTGEAGLRALSACLGTATIPVTYAVARILTSRRTAVIAAAFVAVSPLLVLYSQTARAYVLLSFLGALSLLFFAQALQCRRRALFWWAVVSVLALATHYFAVFLVVPEAAWLLIRLRGRWTVLVTLGVVSLVTAALLPLAVYQERGGNASWIQNTTLRVRLSEAATEFLGLRSLLPHTALIGFAAGVIVLVGLLTWARAANRRGGLLMLSIGSAAILLPLALTTAAHVIGSHNDFFYFRNLIAAWVPLAIAAAAVLGEPRLGILGLGAAGVVCALFAAAVIQSDVQSNLQNDDWRALVRTLGRPNATRAFAINRKLDPLLQYYRPSVVRMARGGGRIDEIVLIVKESGTGSRLSDFGRPTGFTEVDRRQVQGIALLYLRSRVLRRVRPTQLDAPNSSDAAVWWDS